MKQLIKAIKKNWIRVWLICILIACSTFIVFAAYTEVSSVKRVVSTTASPGDPFSSNCMKSQISSRRLTASEFPVSVCNFDQGFPKDYSSANINYTFTAELKVKIDNQYLTMAEAKTKVSEEMYTTYVTKAANYSVFKTVDDVDGPISTPINQFFNEGNNYSITFSADTLKASVSSTDIFTVSIDQEDLNSEEALFFVFVKATPDNSALPTLSARLYGTKNKEQEASWSGSILEADCETTDYDFYNYVITGSGVGKVDILWNPEQVKVNKYFLEENELTAKDITADNSTVIPNNEENQTYGQKYAGWKYVTMSVDSTKKSRYELQLYKSYEDQSLISPSSYIVCYFTKTQE